MIIIRKEQMKAFEVPFHVQFVSWIEDTSELRKSRPTLAFEIEEPKFEPISRDQYPALLFTQGELNNGIQSRATLKLATFETREPVVQTVMKSQYLHTMKLADSVFIISAVKC